MQTTPTFSSGFFRHPSAGDSADCFSLIAGQRHSTARFLYDPADQRALVVAGTSDVYSNTVGIWDLSQIVACQQNGALLSDNDNYKVDGAVACLEFWESKYPGNVCPVWLGTNKGHVQLLQSNLSSMQYRDEGQQKLSLLKTAHLSSHNENLPLHASAVSAIAVHPNSSTSLSAGEDGKIFELHVDESGNINATAWTEALDWIAVYDIKYGEDGTNFCTAGATGEVKMWDARSLSKPKTFASAEATTKYISVEPFRRADPSRGRGGRDNLLIAGGEEGEIGIFDVRQERHPLLVTYGPHHGAGLECHTAEVWSIRGSFQRSPVGTFYSCSNDGTILAFGVSAAAAGGLSSAEPAVQVEGWYQHSQAVSSVDAVLLDQGLREERSVLVAATDGGLLLATMFTDQLDLNQDM